MRSKIVFALAALTFAVVGCEKRDTNTNVSPSSPSSEEHGANTGHSDPATNSPGIGGGPSTNLGPASDDDNKMMGGGKDGGLSGDPQKGSESLSGGGAKTSAGATGESMGGESMGGTGGTSK